MKVTVDRVVSFSSVINVHSNSHFEETSFAIMHLNAIENII